MKTIKRYASTLQIKNVKKVSRGNVLLLIHDNLKDRLLKPNYKLF